MCHLADNLRLGGVLDEVPLTLLRGVSGVGVAIRAK
jgi:hypothetical protein